jgi:hypothetical protein
VHYNGTTWTAPTSPPSNTINLNGVWGTAPDDVFAVGDVGTVLHSSGNNVWTAQTSGTTLTLYAVAGSGTGDVYAVGQRAVILHYK